MATPVGETNISPTEAERLLEEGRSLLRQGQALAALEPLRRVLSHWQGDPARLRSLADCHAEIGWALQRTHRPDEALTHLEEAFRLYQSMEETEREQAACLRRMGQALGDLASYETAIIRQEQALALLRPLPDSARDQGSCHTNLGVILSLLGRHEEAIREHEEALALHQSVPGTVVDQAKCHMNIGGCLGQLQRPVESLARVGAALALLRGVPDTEFVQALCYERVGLARWDLGRYEEAIDALEHALALLRGIPGSECAQALIDAHVGSVLAYLGRYAEALQKQAQALALYQQSVGTERQQAWSYVEIGRSLIGLARHQEAIQHLESALALFHAVEGTTRYQAFCIHTIGQALVELGRGNEALPKYDEAMALLKAIDAPALDRATGHRLAAEALRRGGQPEAALARYAQALALYQPEQDREELWQAHYGAGQAHEARGDAAGALSAYLTATEFLEGLRDDVAARANKVAFFQDKAAVYGRLIALLLDRGQGAELGSSDPRLAQWGDSSEAIAFAFAEAAKARALSDLLREHTCSPAAPSGWIADQRRLGDQISRLYAQLLALGREPGEPGRLLRERIQALELERDLLDVRIKRATPRAAPRGPVPAVAAVQELLEPNAALLEYALLPEPARHEGAASAESLRLALWVVTHAGLQTFLLTLPAGKPTATFPEMVRRLRIQPDELGLEERIRLYRFPMERRLKTQGSLSTREHQLAGRLLADALLPTAVQDHLAAASVRQLVVVPDGALHHVPFPALILREDLETAGLPRYEACRFLVHDYAVASVPSAMAAASLRKSAAERRARCPDRRRWLLAFGDPVFSAFDPRSPGTIASGSGSAVTPGDRFPAGHCQEEHGADQRLPATADEVRAVAALFPEYVVHEAPEAERVRDPSSSPQSEVYLGLAATRARLRSVRLDEFRYLIFATHAHVDEENPMLSCIRLTATEGESGFLPAREILELELDADLVTLSACQSGLGRLARGEGIVGLSMAFLSAGARSLVTSLWKVVDQPTAVLVERLHAHLRDADIPRAEALRRAQLEMIAGPHAHPFFWAFSLMGDWGSELQAPASGRTMART